MEEKLMHELKEIKKELEQAKKAQEVLLESCMVFTNIVGERLCKEKADIAVIMSLHILSDNLTKAIKDIGGIDYDNVDKDKLDAFDDLFDLIFK